MWFVQSGGGLGFDAFTILVWLYGKQNFDWNNIPMIIVLFTMDFKIDDKSKKFWLKEKCLLVCWIH